MRMCERLAMRRLLSLLALGAVTIAGCGSSEIDPAAAASMKGMAGLYALYAYNHNNMGPPDADKLKAHARATDPRTLGGAGVDIARLDEYFVSPRDKQSLQIVFDVPVTNLGRNAPLVAYEQSGVRGKKLAVYANNRVEELDEAALQQALEHKAPNG